MSAAIALVEREDELETIERALDRAAAGSGGLLTIEGEAGAGKTALLRAAAELGAERGMLVQRARGGEYERDFPYGVVRQLFEPLLVDRVRRAELLAGSAALAGPVFDPGTASREADPSTVEHGLYWLAADLAAAAPLLLLVDDAQWADLASLRALTYIGRRLDGMPAALGLTLRTGEPGAHVELCDELRREPLGVRIEPSPLSKGAVATLVEAEVGGEPSERFGAACCEATAGNPFLLAELLRAVGSEGIDPTDQGAERLTQLAAGLARSVLGRLARLGKHSGEVARAVAVLEPNAGAGAIAALADLPVEAVAEASERLVAARLLTDSRPVSFLHPLVREAVLADMSEPRRALAHAQAARLLSEGGAVGDTVAAHLLLTEPVGDDWVVAQLRTAATAALGRGAPDAAVRYLRRALLEPPAQADRPGVSRQLGVALLRANDPEGIEVLRTVRAATADSGTRAEIANELASSLGLRNGTEEAAKLLEESLDDLPDPDGQLGMSLRGWLLQLAIWGLERVPEAAIPARLPSAATFPGRFVLQDIAILDALGLGSIERARQLAEVTISEPAEALMEDALAGLPPWGATLTLVLADRGELVAGLLDLGIEGARRRGVLPGIGANHGFRSLVHLLEGDLREAQADAEIAIDVLRRLGLVATRALWSGVAVHILVERGELDAGARLLDEPWSRCERVKGSPGAVFLCARGALRMAAARHAEARHDFLAAAERIAWLPFPNPEVYRCLTGLARCEAALGNDEEARRIATDAVERARRAGGPRGIGVALRTQGALSGGTEGIELLGEAVEVLAGTRARVQHAEALLERGAALRRANFRKEARGPLREALDLAHRCGAVPLEERARTELAATGARPRKAVLSGVESLTPSELRVARMAAEGMTNREVAQALTVTQKTVETHMRHIFQKLDVERRTRLAGVLAKG